MYVSESYIDSLLEEDILLELDLKSIIQTAKIGINIGEFVTKNLPYIKMSIGMIKEYIEISWKLRKKTKGAEFSHTWSKKLSKITDHNINVFLFKGYGEIFNFKGNIYVSHGLEMMLSESELISCILYQDYLQKSGAVPKSFLAKTVGSIFTAMLSVNLVDYGLKAQPYDILRSKVSTFTANYVTSEILKQVIVKWVLLKFLGKHFATDSIQYVSSFGYGKSLISAVTKLKRISHFKPSLSKYGLISASELPGIEKLVFKVLDKSNIGASLDSGDTSKLDSVGKRLDSKLGELKKIEAK